MPNDPINLNLARIVHRVMISPRGWRVAQMRDELGIAQRTYRKYRQLLQENFHPWLRRDGTSALVEIEDGDERYLRLRPPRVLGSTEPDLELLTAAVFLARSMLMGSGVPALARAAELLTTDFRASLRDRDFLLNGMLAEAERMFVVDAEAVDTSSQVARELIRAVVNRRQVRTRIDGEVVVAAPVTLTLRSHGTYCTFIVDEQPWELRLDEIAELTVLAETFTYAGPR